MFFNVGINNGREFVRFDLCLFVGLFFSDLFLYFEVFFKWGICRLLF